MVDDDFFNIGVVSCSKSTTMLSLSTIFQMGNRDEVVVRQFCWKWVYKGRLGRSFLHQIFSIYLTKLLYCLARSLIFLMADNIQRSVQDINLSADDEPFVLPADVVRQAEDENRFILIVRPVMPKKQNLRAIVASMPRSWGFEGLVRGRIIENRRFSLCLSYGYGDKKRPMGVCGSYACSPEIDGYDGYGVLNFIPFWIPTGDCKHCESSRRVHPNGLQ